jgi:hypothetical protein
MSTSIILNKGKSTTDTNQKMKSGMEYYMFSRTPTFLGIQVTEEKETYRIP